MSGGEDAGHPHPFDPERVAAARAAQLSGGEADQMASLLGLIGDPVRSRVLSALLAAEELCVGDVALALGISDDSASYALRVLRTAGFVQRRREGRMAYYRVADGDLRRALGAALVQLRQLARRRLPTDGEGE